VASLVDTNILVYRIDPRDPVKQRRAAELLRDGIFRKRLFIAHQCVIEFVAAVTRPLKNLDGAPLLAHAEALLHAESLMSQFPVLYPNRESLLTAIRGAATYGLPWFDANLWACAEVNGLEEILSEDFQHGRHYGNVRAANPFLAATGGVSELPAMYEKGRQS
jgi:predicted nucleic acid-binding protein